VREQKPRHKPAEKKAPAKNNAGETKKKSVPKAEDDRRQEVLDFAVETVEALIAERGGDEKIWGSMVKQTMKRRRPGFNEAAFGYRSFKALIEDAQERQLLAMTQDEKSGQYTVRLPAGER
jgi:hypothetical protein